MEKLQELIKYNAALTEKALGNYYAEEDEDLKVILDSEKYSVFAGGKRIRPFLAIEFCKLFGGDVSMVLPLACAVEMIHTSSLIHDDLPCMDNDDLRRGKPTNHKVFGEANALLAGDALLIRAFEVLSTSSLSGEQFRHAVAALSCAAGDFGMIGGQIMDINSENKEISLEKLHKLHRKKTGALIKVSALLGCLAAGLDWNSEQAQAACKYAEHVGLSFQIIDDILDVVGDGELMGKNIGTDANLGKTTFMSYYSVDEAREYAQRLTAEAISAIADYEGSEILTDFAAYLLDRQF